MLCARDYRRRAWSRLSGNWTVPALAALILILISSAAGAFNKLYGLGTAISLVISGPFLLGYAIISLNVVRGAKTELEQLFLGFKNFLSAFLLHLINSLLIFLWSLLFIVPGIIKAVSYSLSFYILCDNPDMSANDARLKSMELTYGHKWSLFCLYVSFLGWIILCGLTFGILSVWVIPYIQTATAEFYVSLITGERGGENSVNNSENFASSGKSLFGDGYVRGTCGERREYKTEPAADKQDYIKPEEERFENFDYGSDKSTQSFDGADSLRGNGHYDGEEEFVEKDSDNSPFSDFDESDDPFKD